MAAPVVDILMYHSISDGDGPTNISAEIFEAQMAEIASAGVPVVTMDDYLAARNRMQELPPYAVILTFDDGFRDFAQTAWPILSKHGFRPIVYLPTDYVGREEGWYGTSETPRQLMSWHEIEQLAREGVLFGSHTVSHANLSELAGDALEAELKVARLELDERLGRPVQHFAPPYGLASRKVVEVIRENYETSVGTRLGSAGLGTDVMDLPRLEMFYFTDIKRWQKHLAGRGAMYLQARKVARTVKQTVLNPWQ